jgi:hypothetical protein
MSCCENNKKPRLLLMATAASGATTEAAANKNKINDIEDSSNNTKKAATNPEQQQQAKNTPGAAEKVPVGNLFESLPLDATELILCFLNDKELLRDSTTILTSCAMMMKASEGLCKKFFQHLLGVAGTTQ